MGKPSKKKISRKKTTHHGKNKKLSRRKMKGGVAFNAPFSSLPSSTYIPLNPDVNENPSWNQIDARLLPAMGGGKKTRKKRGGDTDTRFNRMKRFLKRSSMNAVGLKSKNQIAEEKQAKIQEIKNDLENYIKVTGDDLMNITLSKTYKNIDFYSYDEKDNYNDITLLGKIDVNSVEFINPEEPKDPDLLSLMKAKGELQGPGFYITFKHGSWESRRKICEIDHGGTCTDPPIFYIKKEDKRGGKKRRKSRRKRKMKGGSLVGTDIVTGLNTTESNNVMAFGTTGGTDFMKDTILAKGIDSGPYLSEKTVPDPMLV